MEKDEAAKRLPKFLVKQTREGFPELYAAHILGRQASESRRSRRFDTHGNQRRTVHPAERGGRRAHGHFFHENEAGSQSRAGQGRAERRRGPRKGAFFPDRMQRLPSGDFGLCFQGFLPTMKFQLIAVANDCWFRARQT